MFCALGCTADARAVRPFCACPYAQAESVPAAILKLVLLVARVVILVFLEAGSNISASFKAVVFDLE